MGPMLATFIAALSLRFRLSRRKIKEFLGDWFALELGAATIERCIHEFGVASEPVVEQLIVPASKIVHLDETPWYQRSVLRWMWVAVTAKTTVYHIGSRRKEELTALIGEAFMGWLVTDGYVAYRDHARRQRCLAHLIRKGLALAEGYYGDGSLRRISSPAPRVHDSDAETQAVKRLMARIKWGCQCNRYESRRRFATWPDPQRLGRGRRLRLGPEFAADQQRGRARATPRRDRPAHQLRDPNR